MLADRKRVQEHQERFPGEDVFQGLPRSTVLLRVRGVATQYSAAHRFPVRGSYRQ